MNYAHQYTHHLHTRSAVQVAASTGMSHSRRWSLLVSDALRVRKLEPFMSAVILSTLLLAAGSHAHR